MKPKSLEELIFSIKSLPGISKKLAEKLSYNLVTKYQKEAKNFIETFNKTQKTIKLCQECGNLSDDNLCFICQNSTKDRNKILIIVESPLDILKLEKTNFIKCYYHVLNGLIDVSNADNIKNLNLKNLPERVKKFDEIILALSANFEGLATINYLKEIIKNKKITQLAYGIPLGAAVEYIDALTLREALKNRKEIK